MLRALSDRGHRVLSAIAVSQGGVQHAELVATEVFFGPLSNRDINDYLASGEADDKAGSYAIQGRAAQFVQRINGSYSGVVGLPLYETRKALREEDRCHRACLDRVAQCSACSMRLQCFQSVRFKVSVGNGCHQQTLLR